MADTEKDAVKAVKDAEKAAKKAKQERIKQSKPKKEGNVASRAGKSVKKFWKDFTGTIKKVVWPGKKQVLKSSAVVLASIIVVGLVIFGFDRGVSGLFTLGMKGAEQLGSQVFATESAPAEGSDASTSEPSSAETTSGDAAEASTTEAPSEEQSSTEEPTEESTTAANEG